MARQTKDTPDLTTTLALVLGYIAVKELEKLEDRIRVLVRFGYGNQQIAQICNTTPLTVAVKKSGLKKKKGRGSK